MPFKLASPLMNPSSHSMQTSPDVEAQVPGAVRKSRRRRSHRPSSNSWHQNSGNDPKPPKYGDPSATYWKLYLSEAEINDKNLVESLMGNTSSMVILNSLFSSIVAAFIIEIYKTLLPNNRQQTPDSSPSSAVRINIVLFLSFFLSIVSAVSCALIQQWCYEYLNFAYPRTAPHECGRVRTYLFQGLDQFQMRRFMYGTHVLLHISVVLFFWAISDFFYSVDHLFGVVSRYSLVAGAIFYTLLSISPLIFSNSPYNTPMTPLLRAGYITLRIIIRSPLLCLRWYRSQPFELTGLRYYKGLHFDRARLYLMEAKKRAETLEPYAMEWLFTEDDFSDNDMDKFLEGLPGYMSSSHTKKGQLDQYLTADPILSRIKEHFITCATSVELSDGESITRASSCVKALLRIFQYSRECKEDPSVPDKLEEELQLQRTYIRRLIDDFQTLCDKNDPMIALRASCIRALAVQGLLSQLVPQDSRTTDRSRFPVSLIPIYKFFFPEDNTDTIQQLDDGRTPSGEAIEKIWKSLLHDGPLANLTMLAQAVRDREHAPSSSLSFCWKALDILLTQLGTVHSEEPTRAQSDFDNLHENTHTYVHVEERGFRVSPLLDILDTVARGQRLLMVFSGHLKYRNRADVVFGKEHLRNGDLLEAFAHCLPDFISNNSPGVCKDFMEKFVRDDDLWTSLQVNLWNTQRSESPTPDKLRVFEDCCTVLDLAFSVLEDSEKVDWRAPEFGSLSQHFESFIAHCFQGAFMGRATSFRVGIIKARFCKALLSQFQRDIKKEGTVSFRSQWDVASLARLIYTLGLRDKEDAEFWNSYVNGGHIGAEFTAKALEMIDITTCDGPLLIFCQLGHLATTAVPLDQSGLERKDIEKVWELQKKVVENKRLPLNRASDTIWEALGRLREQVSELCDKNSGKDGEFLQRLLRTVDEVHNLRFSGSEGPGQSELAEEQGPNTLVAMNLTSSLGKPRGISNRPSFASESTAVTREPSSSTQSSDGEDGFGKRSADKDSRKTYGRSESPQSYESGPRSLPSRHPAIQGTPGVGVTGQSIGTSPRANPPVIPYFPYMGDARQRRVCTSTRRTDSVFGATRPSLVTRASGGALFSPRRNTPTVLPSPAISSLCGSFDLSDEVQSDAAPSSSPSRP